MTYGIRERYARDDLPRGVDPVRPPNLRSLGERAGVRDGEQFMGFLPGGGYRLATIPETGDTAIIGPAEGGDGVLTGRGAQYGTTAPARPLHTGRGSNDRANIASIQARNERARAAMGDTWIANVPDPSALPIVRDARPDEHYQPPGMAIAPDPSFENETVAGAPEPDWAPPSKTGGQIR